MRLALALALATLPFGALAQTKVGTAVVEGRTVSLFDDGTWIYEDQAPVPANCTAITLGVSYCGDWTRHRAPNAQINAQFSANATTYAQMVLEGLGTQQGMNQEFLMNAVLQYPANASGVNVEDVPILMSEPISIGGFEGRRIAYSATVNNLQLVMINGLFVGPDRTFQFQTYEIGTTVVTEAHRAIHDAFLNDLEIAP